MCNALALIKKNQHQLLLDFSIHFIFLSGIFTIQHQVYNQFGGMPNMHGVQFMPYNPQMQAYQQQYMPQQMMQQHQQHQQVCLFVCLSVWSSYFFVCLSTLFTFLFLCVSLRFLFLFVYAVVILKSFFLWLKL